MRPSEHLARTERSSAMSGVIYNFFNTVKRSRLKLLRDVRYVTLKAHSTIYCIVSFISPGVKYIDLHVLCLFYHRG